MTGKIRYGGDHTPEQWPDEVWDEDHRLFTKAGIDTLTVGVFSWSRTQPAEKTYDFAVLDRVLDRQEVPRGGPHRLRGPPSPLRPTAQLLPQLTTGKEVESGDPIALDPRGVAVLRLQ